MARKMDITEKLSFDGNPALIIKGMDLEVNADAATVLKVMNALRDEPGPKQVVDMYNEIFPDASREIIDGMKLNFADFRAVVENAIILITGAGEDSAGEAVTHTMT